MEERRCDTVCLGEGGGGIGRVPSARDPLQSDGALWSRFSLCCFPISFFGGNAVQSL